MKIISFTKVSNDCEVIESFIRYNSQFVDRMLFVSSCCVDNTLLIIRKLIEEGYNIDLIEEPDISFEERYMDNHYLGKIANETDYDLIVPLDADEFLTGKENPRKILEALSLDRAYFVPWITYVLTNDDASEESFIPKRLKNTSKEASGVLKAILPCRIIRENGAVTSAGRHSVTGESLQREKLDDIWIAHYPTVSREQYILRIYEGSIKSIIRTDQGNTEGIHRRKMYERLQNGEDIDDVAAGYGYNGGKKTEMEVEYRPLNLDYVNDASVKCIYQALSKTDIVNGLLHTGQLMAIKAYQLELRAKLLPEKKNILIFGTGREAELMMNGVPEGMVNVLAYIDNDASKQLGMYNRRLVIPPDYCRFFKYDKIIISSTIFYDDMMKDLKANGILSERISGAKYLFDLMGIIRNTI